MARSIISRAVTDAVHREIESYENSRLRGFVDNHGPYVIKFVQSQWAAHYSFPRRLKISETPALTWGTATYVTPLAFPLSSALYGRIGLVTQFDPARWRVFDATRPSARAAYVRWVQAQPTYSDLVLTVHSTYVNHSLRNKFRKQFRIDCVLFNPDQEAEVHTDRSAHVWMAVTDWNARNRIKTTMSDRLARARFVVLMDEEFDLSADGLPIQMAPRKIEMVTTAIRNQVCRDVPRARIDPTLSNLISRLYHSDGYLHVYITP